MSPRRNWGYGYRSLETEDGIIQDVLDLVANQISEEVENNASDIASEVQRAWVEEAQDKLNGREKHLQRYLAGIQPVLVTRGGVELRLSNFDAVQVERGWAPPDTNKREDGLGRYDGQAHDMRPFLLKGGEAPKQVRSDPASGQPGHSYKIIEMAFDADQGEAFSTSVEDWLTQRARHQKKSIPEAKEKAENFRSGIHEMMAEARFLPRFRRPKKGENSPSVGLSEQAVTGLPRTRTILWQESGTKLEMKHRKFLYAGLRAKRDVGGKFKFSLYRTISDSDQQSNSKSWYAIGIKPAFIMQNEDHTPGPLVSRIVEILVSRGVARAAQKLNGKKLRR